MDMNRRGFLGLVGAAVASAKLEFVGEAPLEEAKAVLKKRKVRPPAIWLNDYGFSTDELNVSQDVDLIDVSMRGGGYEQVAGKRHSRVECEAVLEKGMAGELNALAYEREELDVGLVMPRETWKTKGRLLNWKVVARLGDVMRVQFEVALVGDMELIYSA